MKINENVGTGRKRRKIIYFYEKKYLKNESCADFYADHDWQVGKNMIFLPVNLGRAGPVTHSPGR